MCMLKSGLILKDDVFIPDYDSHEEMIKELKLKDDGQNTNFIRAEFSPPDGDVFAPIDTWKLKIDQDILPKWYATEIDNERFIAAVREWVKKHVITGGVVDEIKDGVFYIKDATIKNVCGSATIEYVHGSAMIKNVCGSAMIKNVCGSATIEYVHGSAMIKNVYDNATIEYVHGSATIEHVYDNAMIEYVYDNATIEYVHGSAMIKNVCGSATIKNVCDSAIIITYKTLDSKISGDALIIDRANKVIYHASDFRKVKRS